MLMLQEYRKMEKWPDYTELKRSILKAIQLYSVRIYMLLIHCLSVIKQHIVLEKVWLE